MKFNSKKISILLLATATIVSCGKISPKGNLATKDIDVEDFSSLNLDGKFRVFYAKGPKSFVEIETYPNIADNLDIDVDNNTLSIKENRKTKGVDFYNITIYSKSNLVCLCL